MGGNLSKIEQFFWVVLRNYGRRIQTKFTDWAIGIRCLERRVLQLPRSLSGERNATFRERMSAIHSTFLYIPTLEIRRCTMVGSVKLSAHNLDDAVDSFMQWSMGKRAKIIMRCPLSREKGKKSRELQNQLKLILAKAHSIRDPSTLWRSPSIKNSQSN